MDQTKAGAEKKGQFVRRIMYIAIAGFVAIAVVLILISAIEMKQTTNNLVEEELKVAANHLDSEYSSTIKGDWEMKGDDLYKGSEKISGNYDVIDGLKQRTGIDYTIFYDKTRMITTLKNEGSEDRIIGTDASDAVINQCLHGGQDFFATGLTIAGRPFYGYYIPMKNEDGTTVGMVFTGRESTDVNHAFYRMLNVMVVLGIILTAAAASFGLLASSKVSKLFRRLAGILASLAGGRMDINVDPDLIARDDEIGIIAEATQTLDDKLKDVIGKSKDMAGEVKNSGSQLNSSSRESSQASEQVSEAVDGISKGAVSQAESVQNAADNMTGMGDDIDTISENVKQLDENALAMQKAVGNAMGALDDLLKQNGAVRTSVTAIDETINQTNASAQQISEFTAAISDIASQTNLLSLNASIEAARAGEAGKGFAVVASQISQLADQSRQSASKIAEIVQALLANAESSVDTMKTLSESFNAQGGRITATKDSMDEMKTAADQVADNSSQISDKVGSLNTAKDTLTGIISDLSAISEENAASTEETNASMEELNANFTVISNSAEKLQDLAEQLTDTIGYFN